MIKSQNEARPLLHHAHKHPVSWAWYLVLDCGSSSTAGRCPSMQKILHGRPQMCTYALAYPMMGIDRQTN